MGKGQDTKGTVKGAIVALVGGGNKKMSVSVPF